MVTTVGMGSDYETLLKDLISLEHDALAAYLAAIERLEDQTSKSKLEEFASDHRQHIKDLISCATSIGVEAPTGPDAKVMLTKGKVVVAGLIGDKSILTAMKTNEDDTVTAYTRACEMKTLPSEVKPIFQRGLSDETRHRTWIENRIEQLNQSKAA